MVRHAALSTLMMMSMTTAALSSSQFLKSVRRLEDGEEVEEDGEEVDYTFLSNYNVLYRNCFKGDYTDADNIKEPTASFQLCPSNDDCISGCTGGGTYTANFNYFLDAFTELQLGAKEYACEMVRESCEAANYYNDEDDEDDEDYYNCYINAGNAAGNEEMYNYCYNNGNEELQLQQYLECEQFEFADDNGNALYIGPYCSDSIQIYIGIFSDEYCTVKVGDPNDYYDEQMQYTETGGTSIIVKDDNNRECAKCTEHGLEQDQNANDKEDEDDTLEQCEELYANTINRCENEMEYQYGDDDQNACEIIGEMEEMEEGLQSREIQNVQNSSMAFVGIQAIFWVALVGSILYMGINSRRAKDSKSAKLIPNKRDLH